MDYKWLILSKLGHFELFKLKTSTDRVFSRLSENLIFIEIERPELKL